MRHVFRLIAILFALTVIGVVGYAYFGDMSPHRQDVRVPVTLDVE